MSKQLKNFGNLNSKPKKKKPAGLNTSRTNLNSSQMALNMDRSYIEDEFDEELD